jgi:hypothetical protein
MVDKKNSNEDLPLKAGKAKVVRMKPTQGSGTEGQAASCSPSRRKFLASVSVSAAAAATAASVPSLFAKQGIESSSPATDGALTLASEEDRDQSRRERAFRIRLRAAIAERRVPVPQQDNNGDEALYPNRIGNHSKDLPHDGIGEVDPTAYDSLLAAVTSGDPDDFAKIPLGGNTKLANPQGGLAFCLEGTDSGQLTIPPSPALASAERAGEMVEDYWMALTRDIPFSQYGNEALTAAAIAELNGLSDFKGPRVNGQVTPDTLFRGSAGGDLIGPYISQFLLLPVKYGPLSVPQQYETYQPGTDYLTDFPSWLACQNGSGPFPTNVISGTSYIKNGRDLGAWLHVDFSAQGPLTAYFWLVANRAPLNPGNPYLRLTNQAGGPTFGNQHILSLQQEVAILSLKAGFYQKWFVHRALRPEAYGGLVDLTMRGVTNYRLHNDVLKSQAIQQVFSSYGSYLLPHANPEGCPAHPAYPAAHAVANAAAVTALKAFFDERYVIPNPVVASDDGQSLVPYTGNDADQITVGNELNKLASNIAVGRNHEAVHWRSDATQGLRLGEAAAISILRDQHSIFNEPFDGFTFTKFNGMTITV